MTLSSLVSSLLLHSLCSISNTPIVNLFDYNMLRLTSRPLLKQFSHPDGRLGSLLWEQRAGKSKARGPIVMLGSCRGCPRVGFLLPAFR